MYSNNYKRFITKLFELSYVLEMNHHHLLCVSNSTRGILEASHFSVLVPLVFSDNRLGWYTFFQKKIDWDHVFDLFSG